MGQKSKRRIEMGEEAWAEYQTKKKMDTLTRLKNTYIRYSVNWRRRAKMQLIEYKGGKCCECGYEKDCPRAYHFHHIDPKQKEFSIATAGSLSMDRLKKEADKCKMVCSNCHAEIHDMEFVEKRKTDKRRYDQSRRERLGFVKCLCGKEFKQDRRSHIYCSPTCCFVGRRKVIRPTRDEFINDIKTIGSWTFIAKKYVVTNNTIKKWAIGYDIKWKRCQRGVEVIKQLEGDGLAQVYGAGANPAAEVRFRPS